MVLFKIKRILRIIEIYRIVVPCVERIMEFDPRLLEFVKFLIEIDFIHLRNVVLLFDFSFVYPLTDDVSMLRYLPQLLL